MGCSAKSMLIACLLCLSACSSTTFVYNRLDIALPWYLDDYVELDSEQDDQLDVLLAPFLAWHRQEELPRYIGLLDRIDSSLDQQLTADDLAVLYDDAQAAWLRLEARALDWLLAMGASLSDRQVSSFIDHLQEQQQDFEKEYLSRSGRKYREDAYERLLDSMQDYLGRLDQDQRDRLREAVASLQRADGIWLQERAAWLEQLERILQREPGWQQQILDAVASRDETTSLVYRETFQRNMDVIFGAIADVLNSRSARQDKRLRNELNDLRDDLQTLVSQGVTAG
jgi:hypothetical protein